MTHINNKFNNLGLDIQVLITIMSLLLGLGSFVNVQAQTNEPVTSTESLIYFEADPLAYINKGYSVHLGYENWGWRFDLTKVSVDFPESFENAFYQTKAFDLSTKINGIKIDRMGDRDNWTRGAFIGLDMNHQQLDFEHRATSQHTTLNTINIGIRTGYKLSIFRGFYITPWAALWRNISSQASYQVGSDLIETNKWDWIVTFHLGYAIKL